MGIEGSCHCGAVRIEVPRAPEWVASCNCSICRRTGWLVAYYPADQTRVTGPTAVYSHGDRLIGFHHCPTCGCGTHWAPLEGSAERELPPEVRALLDNRRGINARLLDGFDPRRIEIRHVDNADR